MSYEWARMSEPASVQAAFAFALTGSLGAVLISSWGHLGPATAWMGLCAAVSGLRRKTPIEFAETVGGALYVGLPAAIFLWLRDLEPKGRDIILALFAIIWAADIFAYFGGKVLGGPRVASGLSPNKTWSGIACGAAAGVVTGITCAAMLQGDAADWMWVGGVIAFTGLMGDLFESFLKRRFGVKDASQFIPGHGGVLDRIDSLMAATLLVGALVAAWPGVVVALLGADR
jgi:phosphatidate cytidylyltransferase